ncbi:LCP family protein [Streptomyces sp. NPDC051907]|uniref:LCP family protein n=1 Tax=Streptomyces sp. NPDC051907 TaxID=3155284 RepID=UPI003431122C
MAQNSVRGEGTREGVPHARELGWDDGLYGEGEAGASAGRTTSPDGQAQQDGPSAQDGPGRQGGGEQDDTEQQTDADAAPEGSGGGHRRAGARRRGKRGKHRILRWTAISLSVLILGTAGAGYLYYEHLNGNIRKGKRTSSETGAQKSKPNAAGQTPLNVLLIGSDSRNTAENLELGGHKASVGAPPLADVQMLLHVSADRKNASVVSIPRDTRVDIPACEDPKSKEKYRAKRGLINETLQRGGPGCTLATWELLTDVYIDHWMMVDFAGVVDIADAVGGAEVCVRDNVWDRDLRTGKGGSGLKLTEGTHEVQGVDALKWLRTRKAFGSDFGRSKAQHMYMNSVIRNLKSQNAFTDTGRLMDLAEKSTKALQVSEEIGTVKKLYDLSMQLADVPTDRIAMLTMPRIDDPSDKDRVLPMPGEADKLWKLLREDTPVDGKAPTSKPKAPTAPKDPAAAPAEIGVMVRNGTGAGGQAPTPKRASTVAGLLVDKGFTGAKSDTTQQSQERTQILYPSADLEGDAYAVAKALGVPASALKKSTGVSGVTLVVGADWRTGDAFPKAPPVKAPSKEVTDTVMGDDKGACMDIYKPYRF